MKNIVQSENLKLIQNIERLDNFRSSFAKLRDRPIFAKLCIKFIV